MKRLIFSLAAILVTQVQAATVSISVNSNGGPMFTTSAGDLITLGSCIRIGVFDISGANLTTLQTSNDYYAIDALFTPLGESGGDSGTVTQFGNSGSVLMINDLFGVGNVLGQIANIDSNYLPAGQQLYAWVFNSNAPLGSEEWGIYTASTGWNFQKHSALRPCPLLRSIPLSGVARPAAWPPRTGLASRQCQNQQAHS